MKESERLIRLSLAKLRKTSWYVSMLLGMSAGQWMRTDPSEVLMPVARPASFSTLLVLAYAMSMLSLGGSDLVLFPSATLAIDGRS
jgi:hypothetical protein